MSVGIDFYDELEMLATSRTNCEIVFMKDGGRSIVQGVIYNLSDPGERAFLRMDSGLEILLADLLRVNGKVPSNLC